MNNETLIAAFIEAFPGNQKEQVGVIRSVSGKGDKFYYAQNKENRLKVFHDRVEAWEKTDTKNPVKTLELKKQTIQVLNKLYEEDSIL